MLNTGVQLPLRLPFPHLYNSPGSRRQAYIVLIHCWFYPQCSTCWADDVRLLCSNLTTRLKLTSPSSYYWNASPTGTPAMASAEKARGDALKHIQQRSQGQNTVTGGPDSLVSGSAQSIGLGSGGSSSARKGPSTRRRG